MHQNGSSLSIRKCSSVMLESFCTFPGGCALSRFSLLYTLLFASLILYSEPLLSKYIWCFLLFIFFHLGPHSSTTTLPALARCFIVCLLKRRSITRSPFSLVASHLPPLAQGGSLECSFLLFATPLLGWESKGRCKAQTPTPTPQKHLIAFLLTFFIHFPLRTAEDLATHCSKNTC